MNSTAVTDRVTRSRMTLTAATFSVSGLLVAQAIVWLLLPDINPFASAAPVLIAVFFNPATAAAVELGVGVVGMVLTLVHASAPRARGGWMRVCAFVSIAIAGIGLLGYNGIAFSGYALVGLLPLSLLAGLALLGRRHPWLATAIGVVIVGLAIAGQLSGVALVGDVALQFVVALSGPAGIAMLSTLSVIGFTGVWLLAATRGLDNTPLARAVLRHRVPITVAAAACSLPYVIARLSWLTPWPLFGSPGQSPVDLQQTVLVTGLALGAAMVVGGLLTLGLILPWGERFPRWMGPLAGRPVRPSFAVVPAAIVAALFTFSGIGLAIEGLMGAGPLGEYNWTMGLVLPFWLWWPLLALAAWGYQLHQNAADVLARRIGR